MIHMFNEVYASKFLCPMRRVSGLDVHKDSVFLCIVDEDGVVFQSKFGVLTPELEQMAGVMVISSLKRRCTFLKMNSMKKGRQCRAIFWTR